MHDMVEYHRMCAAGASTEHNLDIKSSAVAHDAGGCPPTSVTGAREERTPSPRRRLCLGPPAQVDRNSNSAQSDACAFQIIAALALLATGLP
eukprot:1320526-Pyramimonas_sp.AAC.1